MTGSCAGSTSATGALAQLARRRICSNCWLRGRWTRKRRRGIRTYSSRTGEQALQDSPRVRGFGLPLHGIGAAQRACLLNVGGCVHRDNFYNSGVTSVSDPQWLESWRTPYNHSSLQLPWYACLGNHDYIGNPQAQVGGPACKPGTCSRRETPDPTRGAERWLGGVLHHGTWGRLVAHAGPVLLTDVSVQQPKRTVCRTCQHGRALVPGYVRWHSNDGLRGHGVFSSLTQSC